VPRIAILNILCGFIVIFLSACGGAFLSLDVTEAFKHDLSWLDSWDYVLLKSAHNHFNQFGYLMIFVGLTMPYSELSQRHKSWQTIGLICGCIGMGPGMVMRASIGVTGTEHPSGIVVGVLVSLALVALFAHIAGLMAKLKKRV